MCRPCFFTSDCRNSILGVVAGWEEIITSLELTLELYDQKDGLDAGAVKERLETKYKGFAGNPERLVFLTPHEVDALAKECAETPLDGGFLYKIPVFEAGPFLIAFDGAALLLLEFYRRRRSESETPGARGKAV